MSESADTLHALELIALRAWPAADAIEDGVWRLRFNSGYTKRANSAVVLGDTRGTDVERDLDRFTDLFASRGLPLVIRESSLNPNPELTRAITRRRMRCIDETIVMTGTISASDDGLPIEESVDQWLERYAQFEGGTKGNQMHHRDIVCRIANPICLAVLEANGEAVSCGLGVRENEWLGLFDIATNPDHRRQGHGRRLVQQILNWGHAHGATRGYLQVVARNEAAIPLYEAMGFREAYRYQYWVA